MSTTLLKHNVQLYSDFEALLKEKHKAMVVAATGTGKTSIALKYLEDHDLHGLVVCPQKSICQQWRNISPHVDTMTYNKFTRRPDISAYDCFIFDEAHHTGAEKWGVAVKELISSTTKPVIGLTADPKRYLDCGRDMGEELWDGNVVYGVDLDDAIQKKILPKGLYICTLFDGGSEMEKYKNMPITDKLKGRLEMSLRNCQSITQILHKHMPSGIRKGIVFVDGIKNIHEGVALIKKAYPTEPVVYIHSNQTDSENANIIDRFKDMAHGYIVTVNMLNEGIHMPDINTIIMLRRTSSPNLFMQQLGRGFTPSSSNVAIFDFVANNSNLNAISKHIRNFSNGTTNNANDRKGQPQPTQFIVYDYASPVISVLKEIKAFLSGSWTAEEDDILRKYYQVEKGKIINHLPGRTLISCRDRAGILGLCTKTKKWTPKEDDILRKYYPTEGCEITNRLPGRTLSSCQARAGTLGLCAKKSKWTSEEDDVVRKYYPTEGYKVANRLQGKTMRACKHRAGILGLWNESSKKWTAEEDDILRKYFPIESCSEVTNRLPGRTPEACHGRAYNLGLCTKVNYWTPAEDAVLRRYYQIEGEKSQIAFPEKPRGACRARARVLGIRIKTSDWTPEEDDIVKKYYPTEGCKIASRLPGRTPKACKSRAAILGIQSKSVRIKWTPEEESILRQYFPIEECDKVAKRLPGRTIRACQNRANILGIQNESAYINRKN